MADTFRFQAALDSLQVELKQAVNQQAELGRRIASLRQSVSGLLRLRDASFDEDEPGPGHNLLTNPFHEVSAATSNVLSEALIQVFTGTTPKLTEACRTTLNSATQPMTAGDVRRELEIMGFDFSKYNSNPLSAIHTTLKRDRGVRSFKRADGKTVYEVLKPMDHIKAALGVGDTKE